MKTFVCQLLCLLVMSLVATAQTPKLTPLWETDTTLTTPESVLFDAKNKVLYVIINLVPAVFLEQSI